MPGRILLARCTRQTLLALLMAGAAASERAETAEIAGAASKTSHRAQPGGGSSLWRGGEGGRCPPGDAASAVGRALGGNQGSQGWEPVLLPTDTLGLLSTKNLWEIVRALVSKAKKLTLCVSWGF